MTSIDVFHDPNPPAELANEVLELLKLANENGKIGIEFGYIGSLERQKALEWMQVQDWIRLIDLTPVAVSPGKVFRVFLAQPIAVAWRARMQVQ